MSKLAKALTAAAGNAGGGALYVEDVFSTYLYEGNSSTQTITNGIDLDGEGGLVWLKIRPVATSHVLVDTERGASSAIFSDSTDSEQTGYPYVTSFNSDGFTLGNMSATNDSSYNYASWTFRKAKKFFDVVTYTGNGTTQEISHNLGSTPACIIVKNTQSSTFWAVYHGSIPAFVGFLNATNAFDTSNTQNFGNNTSPVAPTDSVFTVGQQSLVNSGGETYVAYLFASDAGGFGDNGSENIIKCGSYVGTGSATVPNHVELGFEPQYWLIKNTTLAADWWCIDTMRGAAYSGTARLFPNSNNAEVAAAINVVPTATGFDLYNNNDSHNKSGETYIYIAIRRPMKTPESGTEVYNNLANRIGTSAAATISGVGFAVDLMIPFSQTSGSTKPFVDRLRGPTKYLLPPYSNAEQTNTDVVTSFASNDGVLVGADATLQVINNYYDPSRRYAASFFKRATGFFDVVAYNGDGTTNRSIAHNLGVTPELIIYKSRSDGTRSWIVWQKDLNSEYVSNDFYLKLESTNGVAGSNFWDGPPTSSTFQLSGDASDNEINGNGQTYIAYLFATLAGVSKVGSYTGTGADLNVDCGFSAGARFILIKRTDSTGDWYVWDSARGIVVGNDPYILLNTTGADVTDTDYIDPLSSGFTVTSSAPAELNASGGTYIFLAIA
jgi:hypothetical protein